MRRVMALLLLASRASAEPPIVDRNYAIDFYEGTAVGDSKMVGMGGTGIALIPGSAGTLLNASAPAVRMSTDNDHWSWDWHVDYLNGQLSSDFDNNGTALDRDSGAQLLTLGASYRRGKYAVAVTGTIQTVTLVDQDKLDLRAQNLRLRFALARWFPSIDTSIGIGFQSIIFRIEGEQEGMATTELFSISGGGLMAGATWLPRMENFRVAVQTETPIIGGQVGRADCDPNNCTFGTAGPYILPGEVESSVRFGAGAAYRWAETAWNQQVPWRFRDERAVTAAVDLWLTGPSKNGFGIEKFAAQELQRSGKHTNLGVRGGVEYEMLPGRLRLRGGSYYEPSRFDGVAGRVHGTFGVEVRFGEFNLWGVRRGRTGITMDLASHYRNIGLSLGFWH